MNLSNVKVQAGDFKSGELGEMLEPYLGKIADEMKKVCKNRKTLVFLPLIKTSQKFRDILNEKGFSAAEINCQSTDRAEILADFQAGKYNVVCNAMLLTEGFDMPEIDCVIILRPTKIRSLYAQMAGRGTRLAEGKKDLLLLDFLWLTSKHALVRPVNLICKDDETADKMTELLNEAENGADLEELEIAAISAIKQERERKLAMQLAKMRNNKRKTVDPLQFEMSVNADILRGYKPVFDWEKQPPTTAQYDFLESNSIYTGDIDCAGKAQRIIDVLQRRHNMGLSTVKQIRCLENMGFLRVGNWTKMQASELIGKIAGNDWDIPTGINPKSYVPSATLK